MARRSQILAVLSYLWILVVIPLLYRKSDSYVNYHMKQGLGLLSLWVILPFLLWIPIVGWALGLVDLALALILLVIGFDRAALGKERALPVIGKFCEKIAL
ncbi:hypothetical protein A2215_03235 [Candidatus Berkelbacteria bacterium RIFOXYA2_FULL_43_10]|uniref:Uncharacterized protein n=1 Tax=Candidatus Berkelbacteria bacterium RIFOXYA2_FULL_43_10 TaxID=1797472 RepID=A0A1F5EE23_9BACT|nr:MAG: hypothetical protein A2215_03235 [Candidatus Berkelbacteria bacterium RIFOXYA2_FULL_43_10]